MASFNSDKAFRDAMVDTDLLDKAIEWIGENLEPTDVFSKEQLETWAENNGYVKEEA